MEVSFSNTEIAFQTRSNQDLKWAYRLFTMMASPFMVNVGKWGTKIAFSLHLPVEGMIRKTLYRHFVGGDSIASCENTIASLWQHKIGTILDYSVEGKENDASFDASLSEILRTFDKAKGDERIPFCVFKMTGFARQKLLEKISSQTTLTDEEQAEWERVRNRVLQICQRAYDYQQPVFIDAEETWLQPAIDGLAEDMLFRFNHKDIIVYTTLQLYRTDRLGYLRDLHRRAKEKKVKIGVKLVRGAYMEKERERAMRFNYPDPIHPNKQATDHDYNECLRYCIENINEVAVCVGTHNEESSYTLVSLLQKHGLPNNHPHVYFSQLLGMGDHISYNLSHLGYRVVKYVPYGPVREVTPYLMRRAEENTAMRGQTGRELTLITTELQRRKILT